VADRLLFVPDYGFSPPSCEAFPALQVVLSDFRASFDVEIFHWPTLKGGPAVAPTWQGTVQALRAAVTEIQPDHIVVVRQIELSMLALTGALSSVRSFTGVGMGFLPATLRAFGMESLAEFASAFFQWGKQGSYQFIQLVMPSTNEQERRLLAQEMDGQLDRNYETLWLDSVQKLNLADQVPQISTPMLLLIEPEFKQLSQIVLRFAPHAGVELLDSAFAIDNEAFGREVARKARAFIKRVRESSRLLTLMVTDIVDSTLRAVELGAQRWGQLLSAHHGAVRRKMEQHGGREIDTAGDGFLIAFESPARAVSCAREVVEDVKKLGLETRVGIHTGECEVLGERLVGASVHAAARVASKAAANEVLLSEAVRQLLSGSGVQTEDRGRHELKGLPGEWRLFALGPATRD
jgi:class 3 adenylate cyclase